MQYATKEASRRMARPRQVDWALLKRFGRYVLGAPRLVQLFRWLALPKTIDILTDSDWTGSQAPAGAQNVALRKWRAAMALGPLQRNRKPRCELFTPLRVAGAPPAKSFTPSRVTEGRFVDTGESFRRVDW